MNEKAGETHTGSSMQEQLVTFDQAIAISSCAVNAEFVQYYDMGWYVEYEFKVNEVLYGDVPYSTIFVFSMAGNSSVETDYSYSLGEDKYTENESYILIMMKNKSIFYEHDRYISG